MKQDETPGESVSETPGHHRHSTAKLGGDGVTYSRFSEELALRLGQSAPTRFRLVMSASIRVNFLGHAEYGPGELATELGAGANLIRKGIRALKDDGILEADSGVQCLHFAPSLLSNGSNRNPVCRFHGVGKRSRMWRKTSGSRSQDGQLLTAIAADTVKKGPYYGQILTVGDALTSDDVNAFNDSSNSRPPAGTFVLPIEDQNPFHLTRPHRDQRAVEALVTALGKSVEMDQGEETA